MRSHIDIVAILFIVYGILQVCLGVFIGVIYGGMGLVGVVLGIAEGEPSITVMSLFFVVFAAIVLFFVMLMAVLPFAAGIGVKRRAKWGRIMGIIASALSLMSFPLGTALGVYGLIVLIDKEVGEEFEAAQAAA